MLENIGCRAFFDEPALVKNDNAVTEDLRQPQVVRNKETGNVMAPAGFPQEADDFQTCTHIEGARRFVAEEQLGLQAQGPQDSGALAFAAAYLVGIAAQCFRCQLDFTDQALKLLFRYLQVVVIKAGADAVFQGKAWVKGAEGILKDQLDVAVQFAPFALGKMGNVLSCKENLPAVGWCKLADQADEGAEPLSPQTPVISPSGREKERWSMARMGRAEWVYSFTRSLISRSMQVTSLEAR